MKLDDRLTDERILLELGERFARLRLEKNLTQSDLARQAGIGVRTVQRLETGAAAIQLSGFLRVCRTLGLVGRFDLLIPEPVASPILQLKQKGKTRRRAARAPAIPEEVKPWKWGDEA